ncbi:unnamed protein product, partial [Trichogramma brassicae]
MLRTHAHAERALGMSGSSSGTKVVVASAAAEGGEDDKQQLALSNGTRSIIYFQNDPCASERAARVPLYINCHGDVVIFLYRSTSLSRLVYRYTGSKEKVSSSVAGARRLCMYVSVWIDGMCASTVIRSKRARSSAPHRTATPSSYTRGHSTQTALLGVMDDARRAIERSQITVLVLIDFSKAFDTVPHQLLLAKLRRFNFADRTIRWFASYLRGRTQAVAQNDGSRTSSWLPTTSGVPGKCTWPSALLTVCQRSAYQTPILQTHDVCRRLAALGRKSINGRRAPHIGGLHFVQTIYTHIFPNARARSTKGNNLAQRICDARTRQRRKLLITRRGQFFTRSMLYYYHHHHHHYHRHRHHYHRLYGHRRRCSHD